MAGAGICLLAMMTNLGQTSAADPPAWKVSARDGILAYEHALDGLVIDDPNVYALVCLLDPVPKSKSRPFKDERLEKHILNQSRDWLSTIFQPRANPFEHGLKAPTAYDLAPDEHRRSHLRYEWETPAYRFEIIESAIAVALRAQPRNSKWWENDGVPSDRVDETIRALLRDDHGHPLAQFRLPGRVESGKPFTNHPDGFTWTPESWRSGVVGFVTRHGLTLIVPKEPGGNVQLFFASVKENEWIAANLFLKDSDQLVIEKLWGKPYPRAKPQTSK
jgi:hypothetical protein